MPNLIVVDCCLQSISNYDKIRIIALYCLIKNGVTEDNLRKLFTHATIVEKDQDMVKNLSLLGVNAVFSDVSSIQSPIQLKWCLSNAPLLFTEWIKKETIQYSTQRAHNRTHVSNVPLDTRCQRYR